jgi:hypothetical protein
MRLKDLNFKMVGVAWDDGKSMVNELTFDCPKCGTPYRVSIHARLGGPSCEKDGTWSWTLGNPNDFESITVAPSIRNPNHGRKKACGWGMERSLTEKF